MKLEKQLLRDLSYFESDPQTDERDEATMVSPAATSAQTPCTHILTYQDGLVMPKILEILRREPGWDRQAIMSEYLNASTREPGWGENLNRWIDQLLRRSSFYLPDVRYSLSTNASGVQ